MHETLTSSGPAVAWASFSHADETLTDRRLILAVCGFLLLAVAVVFAQTARHEFVNYDDNVYVYENSHVRNGLTAAEIGWAFTSTLHGHWHPLTSISHLLDYQLYGRWAGGHHLTSVLLHAATAVLLFLVLRQMTGRLWPSALAAAVFALHPLRVESVAWVAERKDVLGGLFFMLTLWAYVGYVRRPFSWPRYLSVVVLFALGLMAKSMLMTLPLVLLLLDFWPLGRFKLGTGPFFGVLGFLADGRLAENMDLSPCAGEPPSPPAPLRAPCEAWSAGEGSTPSPPAPLPERERGVGVGRLLVEKIPLLVLAAACCAAAFVTQRGAMQTAERFPWPDRVANVLVSYVAYLGQLFWPAGLAVYYPHPGGTLPAWKVAGASLVLAGHHRRRPGAAAEASLSVGRLVLVPGDAGAGDWFGAVGRPGHGRPLQLPPADRPLRRHRLARGRPGRPLVPCATGFASAHSNP